MPDNLDYKALGFALSLFQFIYMVILSVWLWNDNKHKATKQSIEDLADQLKAKIKNQDDRLIRVESDLEHLPDHEDMTTIHTRINESAQSLNAMRGELKQINNTMQLMHTYLLNGGKP
ncbi:Uncharacterised protein [BD1-7 clade bacterium]|uniref:DUF2730 domain-containing protein n=1 Tax=BD1-7 clade bacterium TaxID=2029982 RepID=A0A5S9QVX3_9GAMM|nr:Uncharacterised protein [BD1-7 clade bacterium]CAA0122880.1 Uncharacterised protein [BD1-7 clade bacterium]